MALCNLRTWRTWADADAAVGVLAGAAAVLFAMKSFDATPAPKLDSTFRAHLVTDVMILKIFSEKKI
jgi:hypothetical protein